MLSLSKHARRSCNRSSGAKSYPFLCTTVAVALASPRADAVPASPAAADPGLDLALGHALFRRAWVSAPASTRSTDGLGPLYNARSCASCHAGVRRLPADGSGQAASSAILFKLAGPTGPDPTY